MPSLFTHQFQDNPCRYSRRVASPIERIDLGWASHPIRVLICLTAPGVGLFCLRMEFGTGDPKLALPWHNIDYGKLWEFI